MIENYFQQAQELWEGFTPFVSVTLLSTRGEAPQDPGAKIIVTESGLHWGTVGGGKIEARTILEAQSILTNNNETIVLKNWNLQKDIGMSCGGEVTYLFEKFSSKTWRVVLFGAGHVAQALIRTLLPLGCQIICVDPRENWLQKAPTHIRLKKLIQANFEDFNSNDFFVVMTQGHATDMPVLNKIFSHFQHPRYVGCIGSLVKAKKIKQELIELGFPKTKIDDLHSPIGLNLGGNDPYEIALSVAAELLQVQSAQK